MSDTVTVECTHVTIHRGQPGAFGNTIHVGVDRLGEQLARLDVADDYVYWLSPKTATYCAVAWAGDQPVLQMNTGFIGSHSELRVGPFPLVFEVSTA